MNINDNKNISQQTSSSKNVVSRSVLRDPVAGRVHVTSFTQHKLRLHNTTIMNSAFEVSLNVPRLVVMVRQLVPRT
jgi:hypothetical protein